MNQPTPFPRQTPILFDETPAETEDREGFRVVLRYEHEGGGPFLIDLSHRPKWAIQDPLLSRIRPHRMDLPESPDACTLQNGFLLLRLTEYHAQLWQLFGPSPEMPNAFPYTDMTDGNILLALMGRDIPAILEKAAPLDLWKPEQPLPRVVQGPVFDIPSILAVLEHNPTHSIVLLACGRSYGQSMAENLLKTGEGWKMRPAGERMFTNWGVETENASDSEE
ncbi:MAG: hypothetical protein ACOC23_03440 [Thermodesulfobacteriota bacterium]